MKNALSRKGFTLTELIIVIALLAIIGVGAYIGLSSSQDTVMNEKVSADLLAIENALNQYKEKEGVYPTFDKPIKLGENRNIRCFDETDQYIHDCDKASYLQTQVDNELLTKRYLQEVPTDPRSNARYIYAVTTDGQFFQVAGNKMNDEGEWVAQVLGNIEGATQKAGLIQAFDSPNLVTNGATQLPYSPNPFDISGRIQQAVGAVTVNGQGANEDTTAVAGDLIATGPQSSVILYLSDGSVTHLDENTELQILPNSEVAENDEDNISSKVRLKLFEGEIWNKVIHLSSDSEFNVETTNAIAGVRGTEFGINADNDTITMLSGVVAARLKTDEEKASSNGEGQFLEFSANDFTADQETNADGQTMKRFKIPVGNGTELNEAEQEEILKKYYGEDGSTISSTDWPYITKAVAHADGTYTIHVTFNGLMDNDGVKVEGFDLFGESQTADTRVLKANVEPLFSTNQVNYDENVQAYVFDIPYQKQADNPFYNAETDGMESIILRGRQEASYSGISWPALGLEPNPNDEYIYEFGIDFYPELLEDGAAKLTNLVIINDEDRLAAVENAKLKMMVQASYDDGTKEDVEQLCEWNLSNENLGAMDPDNPGVFTVNDTKAKGAQMITCNYQDFTATHELAVLPAVMASCFGNNLLNDQGKEDDNGLWQEGSCWVLGEAGQACDTACGSLTATAQCDPDPNWNDCGPDGVCGGDGVADDGMICISLIEEYPSKILELENDYAPIYDDNLKRCFYRKEGDVSCSSFIDSEQNRICKCK